MHIIMQSMCKSDIIFRIKPVNKAETSIINQLLIDPTVHLMLPLLQSEMMTN